jgi:hypothetical protein
MTGRRRHRRDRRPARRHARGCARPAPGGFKCFRADALRAIGVDELEATGFAFQVEMTSRAERAGLRVEEVPIVFQGGEQAGPR